MQTCDTCERRQNAFARGKGCMAFTKKPDNCWAWTDDRDWERKVRVAVGRYKAMRGVL